MISDMMNGSNSPIGDSTIKMFARNAEHISPCNNNKHEWVSPQNGHGLSVRYFIGQKKNGIFPLKNNAMTIQAIPHAYVVKADI